MFATVKSARIELSAGGVIYRRATGGNLELLLIRDSYGNWGFPKGHIEGGEDAAAAALRECREETGLGGLRLLEPLGTTDWYFQQGNTLIHKFCDYFLVESSGEDTARPQEREGIQACEWSSAAQLPARVTYDNARQIAGRAVEAARDQPGSEPAASAARPRGK